MIDNWFCKFTAMLLRIVANTKKMFVQQLSHRARQDEDEHVEEEHDNHGKRSVAYAYSDDDGMRVVEKSVRLSAIDRRRFRSQPPTFRII
jgi:hypothetical protein